MWPYYPDYRYRNYCNPYDRYSRCNPYDNDYSRRYYYESQSQLINQQMINYGITAGLSQYAVNNSYRRY
jgi:hypothetical protein